jgi:hypothetical protein
MVTLIDRLSNNDLREQGKLIADASNRETIGAVIRAHDSIVKQKIKIDGFVVVDIAAPVITINSQIINRAIGDIATTTSC